MQDVLRENKMLRQRVAYLEQELAQIKKLIFGTRSERFVPPDPAQGTLCLEEPQNGFQIPQAAVEPEVITKPVKQKAKTEKQQLPVRGLIPAHIPRVKTEILPEEINLETAVRIGEEVTEYLNYEPGRIYVEQIVRPKYKQDEKIHIASLPSQPIPRSNVGAALLAYILVSKYADHLPLYRQRKMMLREGVDVAQSTLNDWVRKSCQLLEPLYELVQKKVRQSGYLMADETPMPVLSEDKEGSTHKGYYWTYYSPPDQAICFQYHKSRGLDAPQEFLKEFKGYLQCDGYAVYENIAQRREITLVNCMAHARRKFYDALDQDKARAEHALALFGKLYDIERVSRESRMRPEERLKLRREKSLPVMDELNTWLTEQVVSGQVTPKSSIGKAIGYIQNLWAGLTRFTQDGLLEIDNNLIENKIRPVALGRKNYLFAGSHEAAQRAAMIYSFFAMCSLNEINPQTWLANVLNRIGNHSVSRLEELLPANWKPLN